MSISPDDSIEKEGIIQMGFGIRAKKEGGSIVYSIEVRGCGGKSCKDEWVSLGPNFKDVSMELGEFREAVTAFQES